MRRHHELSGDLIPRLRSGRFCLDFAHTVTDEHMHELIDDDRDLARLVAMITDVPVIEVHRGDLARARALREAIREGALSIVAGGRLSPGSADVLNVAATGAPLVPSLTVDGDVVLASGSATQALSTIARDAIDLFAAELAVPGPGRLRVCAADDCGLFILDTSRPNNRRWCSMELCGNRSKIRAYRARNVD